MSFESNNLPLTGTKENPVMLDMAVTSEFLETVKSLPEVNRNSIIKLLEELRGPAKLEGREDHITYLIKEIEKIKTP